MDIIIREYTKQDEEQLLKILTVNNAYFEAIDPWKALKFPEGAERFYLQQMIQGSQNGKFYVAEVDKKIVGFIQGEMHVQTDAEIVERGKSISGDIKEFFVLEEFRSHGIGTQLITTIEKYFQGNRCTSIALDVFAPNRLARDFYQKYGFTERALILVKRLPSDLSSAK